MGKMVLFSEKELGYRVFKKLEILGYNLKFEVEQALIKGAGLEKEYKEKMEKELKKLEW